MALHHPLQQVLQGAHTERVLLEGPPGLEQSRQPQVVDEFMSQEMLKYISQRVNSMLGHATTLSESQVRAELRRMQPSFVAMKEKIQRVDMLLSAKVKGKEPVSQENLDRFLANIDQRREQELSVLKFDLHRTIMGHNHNADLMADHKAAIEVIEGMTEELREDRPDKPALAHMHRKEIMQHLMQISATLERTLAEQELDALLERGEVILQRANNIIASAAATMYHHPPSIPPGHPGLAAHMPPYGAPDPYMGGHPAHMLGPVHPCLGL